MKNLNIDIKKFSEYVVNFSYNTSNFENKKKISSLRLQNLLYLTYVYALLAWNKKLWANSFEKWTIGPVIPEMHHYYSKNNFQIIDDENHFFKITELKNLEKLELESLILDLNQEYSDSDLAKLACDDIWKNTIVNSKIKDQEMIKYYSENETFLDNLNDPSLESNIRF